MSEFFANPEPVVYQLRVVLRGVSPLIWRRLLVCSESTVADLHAVLQMGYGWSGEHLHRFVIQGRYYGEGGRADSRRVRLSSLGLRVGERWLYEYDFTDGWQHDLRLEQIVPFVPGQSYPRCTGGRRAAPPEDCGGPWAFLELRQHYSPGCIARRLLDLFEAFTGERRHDRELIDNLDKDGEGQVLELEELVRWLRIDRFDRRAVNGRLAQLAQNRAERLAA
jgi:Plasmid pRiA4b ORF-3-like protein